MHNIVFYLIFYPFILIKSIQCGIIGDILDGVKIPLDIFNPPEATTINPSLTVETKFVSVEESIFHIAHKLYIASDDGSNHVSSPLGSISLLAQLLMATHGKMHTFLKDFLELSHEKSKRDITVYELTKDPMHDDKLHHPGFHIKLKMIMKKLTSNRNFNFELKNALIYDKNAELVEHFTKDLQKFYDTELIANQYGSNSLPEWIQSPNPLENSPNIGGIDTRAAFITRVNFQAQWDDFLYENPNEETFFVNTQNSVKVKYLQGKIRNAVYSNDLTHFSMIAIPLNNNTASVYIFRPKTNMYNLKKIVYQARIFQDYDSFKKIANSRSSRIMDMDIRIPNVFKTSTKFNIIPTLIRSGGGNPRSKSNILLNKAAKELKTSQAIQEVTINLDNGENKFRNNRQSPLFDSFKFNVETPFLYYIVHEKKKIVMMHGCVMDPSLILP